MHGWHVPPSTVNERLDPFSVEQHPLIDSTRNGTPPHVLAK